MQREAVIKTHFVTQTCFNSEEGRMRVALSWVYMILHSKRLSEAINIDQVIILSHFFRFVEQCMHWKMDYFISFLRMLPIWSIYFLEDLHSEWPLILYNQPVTFEAKRANIEPHKGKDWVLHLRQCWSNNELNKRSATLVVWWKPCTNTVIGRAHRLLLLILWLSVT